MDTLYLICGTRINSTKFSDQEKKTNRRMKQTKIASIHLEPKIH